MSNFVQLFQSIHCRLIEHKDNRVNRVCIGRACQESRLVCDLCSGLHKSHRGSLLTIAELWEDLQKWKNSAEVIYITGFIEQMIEEFSELQQAIDRVVRKEYQKLFDISNFLKDQFLQHNFATYEQLDEQMKHFLSYVELKENGDIKFNLNSKPSDLLSEINSILAQYLQQINDFWIKNRGQDDQQLLQAQIEQQPQAQKQVQQMQQLPPKYDPQHHLDENRPAVTQFKEQQCEQQEISFLQEFCSKQIKCISPKCVRKIGVNISNDIACLNKPLGLLQSQSFDFIINRPSGYIGIGISIFQKVKANNFIFGDLNELGHGVFMVFLNNGLVYNDNDNKYNNKFGGTVQLKSGDKYRLAFDPLDAQGKQFSLQSLSQKTTKYSMPMQIVEGYDYHVFVFIGQSDGEVELLDVM